MNNFLRQFGNFKKNSRGLNEYVDFLGSHYIQDPKTGQWINNGRSLNEQFFVQEAMNAFGGYGEEGNGGKNKSSVTPVYTLGFATTAGGAALANPFANMIGILDGALTSSTTRFFTTNHNVAVPIKLKLSDKNEDFGPLTSAVTFFAFTDSTIQITFEVSGATTIGDESSTYLVPAAPFPASPASSVKITYSSNHDGQGSPGNVLQYEIQIINATTNQIIDTIFIEDTVS